jgi:hypothetical protein
MDKSDNQADGFKSHDYLPADEDPFQQLLTRCYRTMQQPQREAVDADFQTGLAGDE